MLISSEKSIFATQSSNTVKMNSITITNSIRFIGLVLLQGLLLKRMEFGGTFFEYIHVIIYPLFIILLPLRSPTTLVIGVSFLLGLSVDLFYWSIGVHAAAATATGFMRQGLLAILQPRGGYNLLFSPTRMRMGTAWFLRYASLVMLFHLFYYFSVEAFTFVYIKDIFLDTIVSFVFSMLALMMYVSIFDPVE